MKVNALVILMLLASGQFTDCIAQKIVPSIEQTLSLRNLGSVTAAQEGKLIAFTITATDWDENRFDTEIWISKSGGKPVQFTNTAKGSSSNPSFSPDGVWLAFTADRGNKTQIYIMPVAGGEARPVTNEESAISSFEWYPSGRKLLFRKGEKEEKSKKEIEKRYGGFEFDDEEYTLNHLWEIDFNPNQIDPSELPCYESTDSLKMKAGCIEFPKARRLTEGKFTVGSFLISPDGKKIAYSHQPDPLINSFFKSDISVLNLEPKKSELLVVNKSADVLAAWSPDSKEILYTTSGDDSLSNYYKNAKVMAIRLADKKSSQLAQKLDEDLGGGFSWRPTGIFVSGWNKTRRPLYHIDPVSGDHKEIGGLPEMVFGVEVSQSGKQIIFSGRNGDQLNELFTTAYPAISAKKITDMTAQISNWKTAQSEVISWKSKDGTVIEGVLHKPQNYDPQKKYPLLVMIHGGPTGIDSPTPTPGGVYPVLQWLDKGCLILRPNYRGSAGYGEAFRSLNVENLGVGDAWDVLSGVEYLDSKGLIDKTKMGCMGWSQGGYISAFLTTTSDVFKAISVGAGISDWMTYYVNTDIHPFTRQYLKATPWSDEAIYKKTSPMTYINQAKTPTLIQHGEFDRRVPIPNAYQLLQGLRDQGVPAELVVYKGFGHGINKPKERLAANWHNLKWFNKYIWNEEVELPITESKTETKK